MFSTHHRLLSGNLHFNFSIRKNCFQAFLHGF
nr:MAG TPA: hypothetical protein [Caudoviricetes sp.]